MKTLKESLLDKLDDQTKDLRRLRIEDWLEENNAIYANYSINSDYTIDIDKFKYKGNGNFPDYVRFNKYTGSFYCNQNNMTSLEGCPKEVGGSFYCCDNQLISLKGGPKEVGMLFSCSDNRLTSLEGSPKVVGGDFSCSINRLTTLKGGPEKVRRYFYCYDNPISEKEKQWARQNIKCRRFCWR